MTEEDEQVVSVGGVSKQIRAAVLTWEGVESHPHRFGGIEYRLHQREIGDVHGDRLVDLPFPSTSGMSSSPRAWRSHIMFARRAAG